MTDKAPTPNADTASRDRARLFAALAAIAIAATLVAYAARQIATDAPTNAPAARDVHYHININTADADELQLLPGVGPSIAQRIVDARTSGGPFTSAHDLTRVNGIGTKIVRRLAPYVRVE